MEITLQELLDELANDGGDLAAKLRSLSDDGTLNAAEIARLESEAVAAFQAVQNGESISEADVESLETLATAIESLRTENGHLSEQAEAQSARIAEIAARVAPVPPVASDTDTPDETEESAGETEEPADAAAAEVVAEAEQAAEEAANVVVASSTRRRVDLSRVARRTRRPEAPQSQTAQIGDVLIAAADVPGVATGHGYTSMLDVAKAADRRFAGFANARTKGQVRNGLAILRKDFEPDLVADGNDDTDVLARAVEEARLPGGSLLAAGGWCAPSETLYDLCDLGCALDGMVSLPEINAPRGGVRWTPGLDFCSIFNSPGFFHFTEAQMEAGGIEKPCMEIPCPDFQECRLDVDGLCVTGDILQRRGYPEVVQQFIEGVLCAHAHKMNAWKLDKIYTGSIDDGIVGSGCTGATASVLEAIELEVESYKYRGRRSRSTTLEMIAPFWLRGVIRSDLAKRNGVDMLAVTDDQITAWFTQRGVRVDWVYDWQDLLDCDNPTAAPKAWPTEVELIIYEAGTWVAATQDVITLDTIYDSTNLKKNKYTALFTEEGICVIQRCPGSRRFTVPICADGSTGAQVACACPGDDS